MSEEDYVILRGPSSSQGGSDPIGGAPLDLDEAERAVLFWSDTVNPKRRELALALIARVRELEGALEPFAKYAEALDGEDDDLVPDTDAHVEFWFSHGRQARVTAGDFRKARAAIAKAEGRS